MSIYASAGELMIGSRLKRLGERIFSEIGRVYKELGIAFEPAWFPVFFLLQEHNSMTIHALARAMGVTDPAASQFARKLLDRDLVSVSGLPEDKRQRIITLTPAGLSLLAQVRPVWQALAGALSEIESGPDELNQLLNLINTLENGLNQESLISRVRQRLQPQLSCFPLAELTKHCLLSHLEDCPESPLSQNQPGSSTWLCKQGHLARGLLSVDVNGAGQQIRALLFNRWDPMVLAELLQAWRENQGRRLSLTLAAASGNWAERFQDSGFVPVRVLPGAPANQAPQVEWSLSC